MNLNWFWLGFVGGGIALLALRLFLGAGGFYRQIYKPPHVLEYAELVGRVRETALARLAAPAAASPTPPVAPAPAGAAELPAGLPAHDATSAGLVLTYRIAREGEACTHRLSWSRRGRPMAHAAALAYIRFTLFLLGIREPPRVGLSPNGFYHVAFQVDAPAQRAFAARSFAAAVADREAVLGLFRRAVLTVREIPLRPLAAPPGGPA